MAATVTWLNHDFEVHKPPNITWNDTAGVYIFVRLTPTGHLIPLYVGQTNSFADRLPHHERWLEAVRAGANQIHAKVVPQADTRTHLEAALIRGYSPRLNIQSP